MLLIFLLPKEPLLSLIVDPRPSTAAVVPMSFLVDPLISISILCVKEIKDTYVDRERETNLVWGRMHDFSLVTLRNDVEVSHFPNEFVKVYVMSIP